MLEVDQNKDGIISLEEFTAAMSKVVNDTYKDLQTITAPVLKKKKVTLTNKSDLLQQGTIAKQWGDFSRSSRPIENFIDLDRM